jgi:hypothetical protein
MNLVFFSTEKWDLVSALIRWKTDSEFSHCGFWLSGGWTLDSRYDPFNRHRNGVQFRSPKQHRKWTRLELYWHPLIDLAIEEGIQLVGNTPYDVSAIFGIALEKDWHARHEKICSEFLSWCFEKAWKRAKGMTSAELIQYSHSLVIGNPLVRPDAETWRVTPHDCWESSALTPAMKHLWLS